ncbi:uncharacterized protein UV8b_07593 [Ustilaginoidea virens]|uniref:Uncharacterized protein n=1 Tax=Ustilaginoidea virens TaxID=1159556 RepID=A0A8E5HXL8_USTVR|nr:uncharacterized protein UV8b_07593 [Ustilaginoidea virens]QUC23352.1 hypothetical protein UV8b_07593 [Ustilaginoidea virens]
MKPTNMVMLATALLVNGALGLPTPGSGMISGVDSYSTRSAWTKAETEESSVEKRQCPASENNVDCYSTRTAW